jgi:predicted nuclease of predicted toxin-antitoxin system
LNIKIDENIPERLVPALQRLGHDVDTVRTERLVGRGDSEVWQAAQTANRFLITQDLDFSDLRKYAPGTHAGLLLLRLREPGRNTLVDRVMALFTSEAVDQWPTCLVVATEHKVRVKRA